MLPMLPIPLIRPLAAGELSMSNGDQNKVDNRQPPHSLLLHHPRAAEGLHQLDGGRAGQHDEDRGEDEEDQRGTADIDIPVFIIGTHDDS